jgi:hypothetical protein
MFTVSAKCGNVSLKAGPSDQFDKFLICVSNAGFILHAGSSAWPLDVDPGLDAEG